MNAPTVSGITQRIDAITGIPAAYRCEAPPCPRSVKIELTARCDFACWFCANRYRLREKADMEWELLERLLREMRTAGVEEIGLFYLGESFLYPRLPDAVRLAKQECGYPYVFLTSNGRLATEKRLEACFRAGLDSLKFSFNWADEEQCRAMTSVDGFNKVVTNILAARRARDRVERETGHRCGLYASSILYDAQQPKRMEAALDAILPHVDQHYWLPLYGQAGLTAGERGTRPMAGNPGRLGALREPLPCWAVFTEGHITYDGMLSACCFDHDGRFHMADLKKQRFLEAWRHQKFRDLRRAHLAKDVSGTACSTCIAGN